MYYKKDYVTSVVQITHVDKILKMDPYEVCDLFGEFLNIYVLDENKLKGIISFKNYYDAIVFNSSLVNNNYGYVETEEEKSEFRETPVVKDDVFLGVIKTNNDIIDKNLFTDIYHILFQREKITQWVDANKDNCNLIILYMSNHYPENYEINKKYLNPHNIDFNSESELPFIFQILNSFNYEQSENYWGEEFYDGINSDFIDEYSRLELDVNNGICTVKDFKGRFFNFRHGNRVTPLAKSTSKKRIIMFGSCGVMGGFCTDNQTIEYYLQKMLIEKGYAEYEVINCGLWLDNEADYWIGRLYSTEIRSDDIVVIYQGAELFSNITATNLCFEINDIFWNIPNIDFYLSDPSHGNFIVNKNIAERLMEICEQKSLFSNKTINSINPQNYWIPFGIYKYFRENYTKYKVDTHNNGAIVMNANPFTLGHKYLVEYASKLVDTLYIFVVQEDKSLFSFNDRYEMVKQGCIEYKNVKVLASGEYIISNNTFSQYFEKDNVTSNVEDMTYDVRVFCEVVAPFFNIKSRFVGEEPFDVVTRKYNETIRKTFEEYNLKMIEINRCCVDVSGEIINATKVRSIMKHEGEESEVLKKYLPQTTLDYLRREKHTSCNEWECKCQYENPE